MGWYSFTSYISPFLMFVYKKSIRLDSLLRNVTILGQETRVSIRRHCGNNVVIIHLLFIRITKWRNCDMKKIVWEVQYLSLLPVLRYCKKCGKKSTFTCSGQFRINAQRRCLDIWLIYKCLSCDTTWNATIYSRVSPQSLPTDLLDNFYKNDEELVEQYAMNVDFLRGNGVEVGIPLFNVVGNSFSLDETVELEIKSKYSCSIKVSSIIREKLQLSQKEYLRLILSGRIKGISNQNLRSCRLKDGMILVFNEKQNKKICAKP